MYLLVSILAVLAAAAGYSTGAALRAGKRHVEPETGDVLLVGLLWAGVIVYRSLGKWNPAWTILLWLALGLILGFIFSRPRSGAKKYPGQAAPVAPSGKGFFGRFWTGYKAFVLKMGHFQSRLIFSWIYFLLIGPFALAGKAFSDPLGLRGKKKPSYWVEREEYPRDLDAAGRQF